MVAMDHHLLLDEPRRIPGGVSFTINAVQYGQTVFVTDAALARLAPQASSPRARIKFVMTHIRELAQRALAKAKVARVAELIVLEPQDV